MIGRYLSSAKLWRAHPQRNLEVEVAVGASPSLSLMGSDSKNTNETAANAWYRG